MPQYAVVFCGTCIVNADNLEAAELKFRGDSNRGKVIVTNLKVADVIQMDGGDEVVGICKSPVQKSAPI